MGERHGFERQITVSWSDLDANRHLKNTAFSEFAVDTRFQLLQDRGFPLTRFEELRFGPVIFREEIRYRREVLAGQTVTVSALLGGMSADGSQWRIQHEIKGPDGRIAAALTVDGAWLHLDTRKLIAPPAALIELLDGLPRAPEYEELPSVLRG